MCTLLVALASPAHADPLLPTPAWTFGSDLASAQLGASVASAGDVNGDGFGDVVVGVPVGGVAYEGQALVFLGTSLGLEAAPVWSAAGGQGAAFFGSSVASAGDVDGDGFDDVLVGAPGFDGGHTDEGRVLLFLGGASGPEATASWTAEADLDNAALGGSVGAAGDIDADGFDDVVAGAAVAGRAYLFRGSAAGPEATASWTAAALGARVAGAGNVDADGFDDLLVGAPDFSGGEPGEGAASLYAGSAAGLEATPSWTVESGAPSAQFGHAVAAAGDVNGDGYGDVVVGAYRYDNVEPNEGRASVFLGSPLGLQAAPIWEVEPDQGGAAYGYSVAGAGDVDADGFDDLLVGAPFHDGATADVGRVFLYLGSAAGPAAAAAWTADSAQVLSGFGWSVAGAGDVNGDGRPDVVIGAPSDDDGSLDEGTASLFLAERQVYADVDADGFGDPAAPHATEQPGDVLDASDCDDTNAAISPIGTEVCDAADADEDCDGLADDADPSVVGQEEIYADGDDDGHGGPTSLASCELPAGYVTTSTDCDDGDPDRSPTAPELVGDGVDQDCDGSESCYADADGDGFRADDDPGRPGSAACDGPGEADATLRAGDCDDDDPAFHPRAPEPDCDDPADYDCDGTTAFADADGDGFAACVECDDADGAVNPGAPERCNGVDDDCDGGIDLGVPDLPRWFVDHDGDGFTSYRHSVAACAAPAGFAAETEDDCDDRDPTAFPGRCEGVEAAPPRPASGGCASAPAPAPTGAWVLAFALLCRRRPRTGQA